MKTCKCGRAAEGWPGEGKDDELCQDCWEEYCDRGWWFLMAAIAAMERHS
jgi:hypothetical protein